MGGKKSVKIWKEVNKMAQTERNSRTKITRETLKIKGRTQRKSLHRDQKIS